MSEQYKALQGFKDILPDEQAYWRYVENIAAEVAQLFGYRRIETPILEETIVFRRTSGEGTDIVDKEMYSFDDRADKEANNSVRECSSDHPDKDDECGCGQAASHHERLQDVVKQTDDHQKHGQQDCAQDRTLCIHAGGHSAIKNSVSRRHLKSQECFYFSHNTL